MAKQTRRTRLGREDVLLSALTIVDRDGFAALSLASLAVELDRHVSSLYNHVDGLDGLRRDITMRSLEELGSRIWRSALGRSGADALWAIAEAYRTYASECPGRFEAATTWRRRTPP